MCFDELLNDIKKHCLKIIYTITQGMKHNPRTSFQQLFLKMTCCAREGVIIINKISNEKCHLLAIHGVLTEKKAESKDL